jgi:hypothetical protein
VNIRKIAEIGTSVAAFDGATEWETTKPDDTPQKELVNVTVRAEAGWRSQIGLEKALRSAIGWDQEQFGSLREYSESEREAELRELGIHQLRDRGVAGFVAAAACPIRR